MSYLDTIRKVKEEMARQREPGIADRSAGLTAEQIIDIDNGKISAVLIDCDFGPLWFAFDDSFQAGGEYPVFFASELPFLRQMGEAELRRRYEDKKALGGGWIRDRKA